MDKAEIRKQMSDIELKQDKLELEHQRLESLLLKDNDKEIKELLKDSKWSLLGIVSGEELRMCLINVNEIDIKKLKKIARICEDNARENDAGWMEDCIILNKNFILEATYNSSHLEIKQTNCQDFVTLEMLKELVDEYKIELLTTLDLQHSIDYHQKEIDKKLKEKEAIDNFLKKLHP